MLDSLLTGPALFDLAQVTLINLVLSGDNAIVIGMAAAGLPKQQRGKVILAGIVAATVLRIIFAAVASKLLGILGLLLFGGILLLWVCWKLWRDLLHASEEQEGAEAVSGEDLDNDGTIAEKAPHKTFKQAVAQIILADVSMSLDNVLAVAGAARDNTMIMVIGLILSVAMMGLAAAIIARLLNRYKWIGYVGLAIIVYVALQMIWEGGYEVIGQWSRLEFGQPGSHLHLNA